MGFSTALATTAAIAPKVLQAYTYHQQGKALKSAAAQQQQLTNQQAAAMENTASENQRRAARNANSRLASARADAAGSNLLPEGSIAVRERDLATRLQDEITANANNALHEADSVRKQGALNAWQTRQAARQSGVQAIGAGLSSLGSLFSGIASDLNSEK